MASSSTSSPTPTPDVAKILHKVDRRLIPILFFTYMLNFMDKTILSSASVFGLIDDTHLVGQQYSWVSSIFYFGYFMWAAPTNVLIPRVRIAKYLTANTLFWGAVVALTAACTNYSGLLAVRFLLGVAEATITPAFMFITSAWYTRDEIPVRTGVWFSGNSVGGLLASLLAYAVGHIPAPLHPWQWMYIILGGATFLWAFVLLAFLPDSISRAPFLSPPERSLMTHRVLIAGTGRTEKTVWSWAQARECLVDPKTGFLFSIALLTQIPNGGTQNFSNLVIRSFGFTALQSTLINIPTSAISALTIALTGWLAGRSQRMTCLLLAGIVSLSIAGSAIIYKRGDVGRGPQLFGYFLLATGPGALPLTMSLVQANYRGVSKKMTVTALMFVAYCAGNIAGPHLFRTSEAPTYQTSFRAILVCYIIAGGLALALRAYLAAVNRRRDAMEGVTGDAGLAGRVGGKAQLGREQNVSELVHSVELREEDYEDVTDWKTVGFRYRL